MAEDDDYQDDDDDPDRDNLPGTIVPLQLLQEIGAIAVRYSNLDAELNYAIKQLLGLDWECAVIITQALQNFSSRVDLLRTLALNKYPQHKHRIADLTKQLRCAGDDRNRLMHDAISTSELGETYASIGTRRATAFADPPHHIFDVATMKDLQWRMWRLHDLLWDLARDLPEWLSAPLPSLEKSPTLILRKKNEEKQEQGKTAAHAIIISSRQRHGRDGETSARQQGGASRIIQCGSSHPKASTKREDQRCQLVQPTPT